MAKGKRTIVILIWPCLLGFRYYARFVLLFYGRKLFRIR